MSDDQLKADLLEAVEHLEELLVLFTEVWIERGYNPELREISAEYEELGDLKLKDSVRCYGLFCREIRQRHNFPDELSTSNDQVKRI